MENFNPPNNPNECKQNFDSDLGNNFNININTKPSDINPMSGEVQPNKSQNILPNPYLSTHEGKVGGSLVGPQSDVFTKHMIPQPYPEITPKSKIDPIGPYGTHGGPDPKFKNLKKSDPNLGGNPFGGNLQ